jgi:hypothetical protein
MPTFSDHKGKERHMKKNGIDYDEAHDALHEDYGQNQQQAEEREERSHWWVTAGIIIGIAIAVVIALSI